MLLSFSIAMLLLMLMARFRSPRIGVIRVIWFMFSLLPSELPWAVGLLQLGITCVLIFAVDLSAVENILALIISLFTLFSWYQLHRKTFLSGESCRTVLQDALLPVDGGKTSSVDVTAPPVIQQRDWLRPFSFHRPDVEHLRDIAYGAHPRQRLDMYRGLKNSSGSTARPVLLHVHGGGWVLGEKHQQAQPLIHYLAQNGWLCVDINYRLAPRDPYPRCLQDVKTAIAWLKQHVADYGGDPNFIAVVGESAGAHLCTLAALTADHPEFQWDGDQVDTHVQAVVAMYGVYDLTEKSHTWRGPSSRFLQKYVWPATPDILRSASPRHQIIDGAPPIFIVHGTTDNLVFIEDVRDFVGELRQTSRAPVIYAELDGAQHGFDLFHGVRTEYTIEAVGKFLRHCRQKNLNC